MAQVFNAQTANAESSVVEHTGGEVDIKLSGVLGTGVVTLQARFKESGVSGPWVPVAEDNQPCVWNSTTGPLIKTVRLSKPCDLRLSLTNAGGGTNISAWI